MREESQPIKLTHNGLGDILLFAIAFLIQLN
jgi:hypothetical protein